MSILDGEVTRPDSFDPRKNYALVIARGGEHLGDYDLIDAQRIQRYDHAVTSRLLFAEGGIQFETGGNIAPAVTNGVALGGDACISGGTYLGIETQNYIVSIMQVGGAGEATFTWRSTGSDPPSFANQEVTIRAIALSAGAVADHPDQYAHPLGSLGVTVSFVNPNGVLNASSWIVQVVYGARPPLVQKATPDPAHDTITCYDIISMIAGRPHRAAGAMFVVPAASAGPTTIYGQWSRTVVTHVNDADLRDPEGDTPQGWRERWELTYTLVDTAALPYGSQEIERRVFPLYTWDRATDDVRKVQVRPYAIDIGQTQGSITGDRMIQVDQNEILRDLFARRTMDAHGSFVAHPLVTDGARARLSTNPAEGGKVRITLAPSVVYVEGLAILHPTPTDVQVDQANEFATVTDEQTTYTGSPFPLRKTIGERVFPIRNVSLVTAHVQVGTGSAGAGTGYEGPKAHVLNVPDNLTTAAGADIVALLVVSPNANGSSPYAVGTAANQYQLSGNQIVWGAGTPAIAAFYVSYRYKRLMQENVDFTVTAAGYIDFAPGGADPVVTGIVSVTYSYFLPRIDAIIVRSNGVYQVVRGIAAEVPQLPAIPPLSLRYVRVELAPSGTGPVTLRRFANDAISMEQLNRLIDAVIELTQNFAIADLHGQGQGETSGNFLDILADDFVTPDLADVMFNLGGVSAINQALIDGQAGELTVPFDSVLATPPQATTTLPAGETAVRVGGTFFTLPFTDEPAIVASEYSQAYPVNPYASFEVEPVQTRVVPDQDWFEDVANRTSTEIAIIRKTRALAAGLISRQDANRLIREFRERNGRNPRRGELLGALAPEVVGSTVENLPARYMRRITLTLFGTRYVPLEKIRAKFDGKDVPLVHLPAGDGAQGTGPDANAIVANDVTVVAGDVTHRGGDWQATFLIPVEVPVGTRLVTIYGNRGNVSATWNSATPESGGYTVRDTVPYTSDGIIRTSVTQERIYDIILEPIAQSLAFPALRMISKVDIPFATKPPTGAPPLVFEFRATDRAGQASTPIETVLEGIAKQAADVNVGASSSNLFVPSDPILCFPDEFRALVLRSESNAYQVYVAMLGAASLAGTIGGVQQQSVPGGIFMDSANNRDWTPHQGWDLRFTLWVAKMSGTVTGVTAAAAARIYYEQVVQALTTGFTLNVDQVLPDGTAIDWEYSTDGQARTSTTKIWQAFVPFVPVELGAVTGTLDFRATLRTDSLYVTPAIHQKNLSVLLTSNHTTFVYVTKRKDLTEPAVTAPPATVTLHIRGFLEMIEAPNTPLTQTKLYVTVDGGSLSGPTWRGTADGVPCTVTAGLVSEGQSPDGFKRYSFDVSGFSTAEKSQLRLRIEGGVGVTGGSADRALRPRIRALAAYLTP